MGAPKLAPLATAACTAAVVATATAQAHPVTTQGAAVDHIDIVVAEATAYTFPPTDVLGVTFWSRHDADSGTWTRRPGIHQGWTHRDTVHSDWTRHNP